MSKETKTYIRSRYTYIDRIPTEPGRPMHNEYQIRIDDKGHKTLVKTGETNLQDKIEESKEGCLISTVLEMCANMSDQEKKEYLNQRVGQYIKLEELPENLREAQQAIIDIKNEFYKLPTEIREKFDNSPERYVQDYGTENWMKILYPPTPVEEAVPVKKEEVTTNE